MTAWAARDEIARRFATAVADRSAREMRQRRDDCFDTLNENQQRAVSWNGGPLLVLAGPGSGKTRVLAVRVARILEESDDASVLALTFTNKAAAEMRERVQELLGRRADRARLCTFHAFAADVLRQHGSHVGLRPDFTLLTQDEDRLAVLDEAVAGLSDDGAPLPTDRWNLLRLLDRLFAESYDGGAATPALVRTPAWLPRLHERYCQALVAGNRLDFGSLLYFARRLLNEKPGVARVVRLGWTHVCVDEFQDTNKAQYDLLREALRLANARHDRDVLRRLCLAWKGLSGKALEPEAVVAASALSGGDFLRAWADSAAARAAGPSADALERLRTDLVDALAFPSIVDWFLEDGWKAWSGADGNEDQELAGELEVWRALHHDVVRERGENVTLNVYLQQLDLASKAPLPKPGAVRCMTVHGSKGLEFRHVYLIGMAQEVFPSFQALRRGARRRELEEERRNCLVAITRAERTLTLTRAERYHGYPKAPSQFLAEMGVGTGSGPMNGFQCRETWRPAYYGARCASTPRDRRFGRRRSA